MARTPTDPTKAQVWVTKGLDDLDFEFYFPQGPKGDPGGFVAATSLGTLLLDDVKTPGHYRQDNGNNATILNGYPIAAAAGFLEVLQAVTPGDLLQRYTPVAGAATGSGRAFYIRRYFNAAWGAWYAHTSSRVDQAAGRVVYQWDDLNGRDQMIYGDTGWREVSASNFIAGATGNFLVRRVGSVVQANISAVLPDALAAGTNFATFPAGFLPNNKGTEYNFTRPSASTTQVTYRIQNNSVSLAAPVWNSGFGALNIHAMFTTTDPWPTTLPGTANGTVPL